MYSYTYTYMYHSMYKVHVYVYIYIYIYTHTCIRTHSAYRSACMYTSYTGRHVPPAGREHLSGRDSHASVSGLGPHKPTLPPPPPV